jgi:hypothetical protein
MSGVTTAITGDVRPGGQIPIHYKANHSSRIYLRRITQRDAGDALCSPTVRPDNSSPSVEGGWFPRNGCTTAKNPLPHKRHLLMNN